MQRPVYAAVLLIRHPFQHFIGVLRFTQQGIVFQQQIRFREKPEDAAVEDTAFVRFGMAGQIKIYLSYISSMRIVSQAPPEWKQMVDQFRFDFRLHICHNAVLHAVYRFPVSVSSEHTLLCALIYSTSESISVNASPK